MNINGEADHLHALFQMGVNQSVAEVMKSIKGEAAWWANENKLFESQLAWSRGYYARSVDEGNLQVVRDYILHQDKSIQYLPDIEAFLKTDKPK
jgi:REP element-mobilizing transposase RayT